MAFTVNKKAFCVLEFAKTESTVTVRRRFQIMYHTEPPTDKTIREWYMNSSRVAACALRNEQAVRAHRPGRPVRFAQSQLTQFWQIPRHRTLSYSLWTPFFVTTTPSGGTWKYAKAPSTKRTLEIFCTYWYAPFFRVWLGCCAVAFGNPGGTSE